MVEEQQLEVEVEATLEDDDSSEEEAEDDELNDRIQTNIIIDTDMDVPKKAMANMHIGSTNGANEFATPQPSSDVEMADSSLHTSQPPPADADLFVVDTVGDSNVMYKSKANGKRPIRRTPSPARSDSSEEVVVFHGRSRSAKTTDSNRASASVTRSSNGRSEPISSAPQATRPELSPPEQGRQNASNHADSSMTNAQTPATSVPERGRSSAPRPTAQTHTPHVTDKLLSALEAPTPSAPAGDSAFVAKGWAAQPPKADAEINPDAEWGPAPPGSWWKHGQSRPDLDPSPAELAELQSKPRSRPKVGFAEPSAEETIASLQAEFKATIQQKNKAKASMREQDVIKLDSKSPSSKRRGKRGRKKDNRAVREWVTEDDDDDDDGEAAAAYDDYMQNLAAQLGSEDGASGLAGIGHVPSLSGPSLVVDGEEIDEDEVLKGHIDLMGAEDDDESDSDSFSAPIGQDLSELSSSDLEDELDYTEEQQWEDEEDIRQRRRDQMTDEQLARLFAKQQEFGYDGDDLILDNGEYLSHSDVDGVGDVETARKGLANISNFSYGRSRNKRRSGDGFFPSASVLADTVDQYGDEGFDIMDLDRPSLRPTKRGRKGGLPPAMEALSDEDIKDTLRDQWSNDRDKKRLKKAEREELRMQGLLGRSGKFGKVDLSVKYIGGITIGQVHSELRIFLLDDGQRSRPFPPMAKDDRKAVHDIANSLNMKSKSVGTGKQRFLTVYKTNNTPFKEERIDLALSMSAKGLLARENRLNRKLGKKSLKGMGGKSKIGGGPGGATSGASVRHGDIVGAGAAELGKENFGYKLMMKQGWSKGQALGKEGEGRLAPVEQMVRVGKAGLG